MKSRYNMWIIFLGVVVAAICIFHTVNGPNGQSATNQVGILSGDQIILIAGNNKFNWKNP